MNDNRFTISFSTAELLCVATALGLAVSPVQSATPLSGQALQAEIQRGYESLQQRGLVQALSPMRWQVDNLVALLTYWLAAPDRQIRLEMWQDDGAQQAITLYFWQGQALWYQAETNAHHLTLFQNAKEWVQHCLDWIGRPILAAAELTLTLPRLNLVTFLAKARQSPTEAELILQQAGQSVANARQGVSLLATVDRVLHITWLKAQEGGQLVTQQVVVLFTPTNMWGGAISDFDDVMLLRPFTMHDLVTLLGN